MWCSSTLRRVLPLVVLRLLQQAGCVTCGTVVVLHNRLVWRGRLYVGGLIHVSAPRILSGEAKRAAGDAVQARGGEVELWAATRIS